LEEQKYPFKSCFTIIKSNSLDPKGWLVDTKIPLVRKILAKQCNLSFFSSQIHCNFLHASQKNTSTISHSLTKEKNLTKAIFTYTDVVEELFHINNSDSIFLKMNIFFICVFIIV